MGQKSKTGQRLEIKPKSCKMKACKTTTCSYDCGGRCLLTVHVKDGKVSHIRTENRKGLNIKACLKGLSQKDVVHASSRLLQPMKRIGSRGEGRFEPISWDDALNRITEEFERVIKQSGTESIYFKGASGSLSTLHKTSKTTERFFSLLGRCTTTWGTASFEGAFQSSLATFGTTFTGSTRDTLNHSKLIILWGWNPVDTRFGPDTTPHLLKAKKAGARIIVVDPRKSASCQALADEWIPIRPGTDTAMLIAMAQVILTERLHDADYIDTYTFGFERFCDYLTGRDDGLVKGPEWAENICGVPAEQIVDLARDYARIKPAALMTGWAPGRTAYGEQFHRAASVLAAMTGNIGIEGGHASGGLDFVELGQINNRIPVPKTAHHQIHVADFYDAIIHGKSKGYPSDCKLLYIVGSNFFNQYLNLNKGKQAVMKPTFIVVQDLFLTPTAKYADVVLPVTHFFERMDIGLAYMGGPYSIFMNKILNAPSGPKSDLQIFAELAKRLGIEDYNDKSDEAWLESFLKEEPDFPDLNTLRREGVHRFRRERPKVAFRKQIERPESSPFPTPSGKIEIYSHRFAALNNPFIPPIPTHIPSWEGPQDELVQDYPIQFISPHSRVRANSQFDNIDKLKTLADDDLWMNREDAKGRGIENGDLVVIFNKRGRILKKAKVTDRIMPGVASLDQGQWYRPDDKGADRGGCANVLTLDKMSPVGAFPCNSCLVQIEKSIADQEAEDG